MMQKIINEKTLFPLSLVIVLVGGTGWLTSIFEMGKANANSIEELKKNDLRIEGYIVDELRIINKKLDEIRNRIK